MQNIRQSSIFYVQVNDYSQYRYKHPNGDWECSPCV